MGSRGFGGLAHSPQACDGRTVSANAGQSRLAPIDHQAEPRAVTTHKVTTKAIVRALRMGLVTAARAIVGVGAKRRCRLLHRLRRREMLIGQCAIAKHVSIV
jgi:hypothetical protein